MLLPMLLLARPQDGFRSQGAMRSRPGRRGFAVTTAFSAGCVSRTHDRSARHPPRADLGKSLRQDRRDDRAPEHEADDGRAGVRDVDRPPHDGNALWHEKPWVVRPVVESETVVLTVHLDISEQSEFARPNGGFPPLSDSLTLCDVVAIHQRTQLTVMTLDDWYDHDSLIEEVVIDVHNRTVSVRGSSYAGPEAAARSPFTLLFVDVNTVTTAVDMVELSANTFAGHINHAKLAHGPGTSHLYLVEGHMSVTSQSAPRFV